MHASPQGRSQAFETKTPAVITTLGVQQNSDQARSQWGGGGSVSPWLREKLAEPSVQEGATRTSPGALPSRCSVLTPAPSPPSSKGYLELLVQLPFSKVLKLKIRSHNKNNTDPNPVLPRPLKQAPGLGRAAGSSSLPSSRLPGEASSQGRQVMVNRAGLVPSSC